MKWMIACAVVAACVGSAMGQVIYEGAKYQYGTGAGTVFYGGVDPSMPGTPGVLNTPGVQALNQRFGFGGPGYPRTLRYDVPGLNNVRTPVYSDIQPYTDVGQLGFTQNDARNEAYANVPRISTKYSASQLTVAPPNFVMQSVAGNPLLPTLFTQVYQMGGPVAVAPVAAGGSEGMVAGAEEVVMDRVGTDSKAKAIPLISWAKAEKVKNPALYEALLKEAGKWDAEAVGRVRAEK